MIILTVNIVRMQWLIVAVLIPSRIYCNYLVHHVVWLDQDYGISSTQRLTVHKFPFLTPLLGFPTQWNGSIQAAIFGSIYLNIISSPVLSSICNGVEMTPVVTASTSFHRWAKEKCDMAAELSRSLPSNVSIDINI